MCVIRLILTAHIFPQKSVERCKNEEEGDDKS